MKLYTAKTTFSAFSIGFSSSEPLVGVPDNKEYDGVIYNGKTMTLKGKTRLGVKSFPDKFNRDKFYTLSYYEWKPDPEPVEEVGLFSIENKEHINRMFEMKQELIKKGILKK